MTSRKVLLIGWDAADWKVIQPLMKAGRMPNVERLVRDGASGQIATLHPPLSPMLWTSIATGKRPFKHGIHGFTEPAPDGSGIRPVTNLSRKSKAIWNILHQSGLRSVVVGWWPSHPAEPIDGAMVSDRYHRASGPLHEGWPLPANTVHPSNLAEKLAELRMHPDRLTPEMVEPFVPLAREIDQDKDQRLAALLRMIAECMSIQAAAVWLMENRPWDFFAVYFEAIDHFCHGFMRYHPPRQTWIPERDFELYRNVVSAAYRMHDEMLETLLAKAGEDTTVILMSDHGFHPDHLRPSSIPDIPAGPAIEHRDFGVFAIAGPRIKKNEPLHGASVLDAAPTILTLYGLPVGEDMDGKVLSQAFVHAPNAAFIPSWEDVVGADGRHPPHTRLGAVETHEAMERMIALGYIERPDQNREVAIRRTVRELRYNLGEAYQDAGRHREGREVFAELHKEDPDEQRFAVRLFISCQALGLHGEMRRIVHDLDSRRALFEEAKTRINEFCKRATEGESRLSMEERRELARWRKLARYEPPVVEYLRAHVLVVDGRYEEALTALGRVTEAQLARPALFLETADLYLRLGRADEARKVYEKALALDPDNVDAHAGLCRMALERGDYGAAATSALDALQRTYHDPMPHFLLGRALEGRGDFERAAEAFRAAISCNPNFPEAHEHLAALLEAHLAGAESALEHRRLAENMRDGRMANATAAEERPRAIPVSTNHGEMPPRSECVIVVTGLPRSGTSLIMQMLAAGGVEILTDELRTADEDNPRGYLEYEPVKSLLKDSNWLYEARGKAVKIVAPLLVALPPGLACRVLLTERDLEEVLDSQDRMLQRRDQPLAATPERRRTLQQQYQRTIEQAKTLLAHRPCTQFLVVDHGETISHPLAAARRIDEFLGGGLDIAKMAAAMDATLYRNRAGQRS